MSFFALKLVAVLSMLYDHATALYGQPPLPGALGEAAVLMLPYLGRLAAPIFMFQIANGYRHTHDLRRYVTRIFLFGAVAQLPYALFFSAIDASRGAPATPLWATQLNFLFTLGLGLLAIAAWEYGRQKDLLHAVFYAALPLLVCGLLRTEGGFSYAALVLAFHLTMDWPRPKRALIWLFLFPLAWWYALPLFFTSSDAAFLQSLFLAVFGPYLGVLLTLTYNGQKGRAGRVAQLFVYAFYPLHLLLLALFWNFFPV